MNQTHIAGGPLGVARVDRPLKPRSGNASGTIRAFLTAIAFAVRVLAGAAIVEAIAVSSFGLVAGTVIAVLAAMVMGISYLALGRWSRAAQEPAAGAYHRDTRRVDGRQHDPRSPRR
jgi:cytochrome c-type biogenesis protein CcmH/NrfG